MNFRFRLLVTRSSLYGLGASSHLIWCKISLSSPKLLTFFPNSRWRPPPSWIFSYVNLVIPACWQCGICVLYQIWFNICYSHWDRRTYASGIHLIKSRELTSGFDFWSRGHLCMAVIHFPWNLVQISLSNLKLPLSSSISFGDMEGS